MDAADNDLLCTIPAKIPLDNSCHRRGQQGLEDDLPCASLAHLQLQGAGTQSCHLMHRRVQPLQTEHGVAAMHCACGQGKLLKALSKHQAE